MQKISLLIIILVVSVSGCVSQNVTEYPVTLPNQQNEPTNTAYSINNDEFIAPIESVAEPTQQTEQTSWQLGALVIEGNYADAEIVDIGNNVYRMYYAIEPEVQGNKLEVFSSTSSDGIKWQKEQGTRKEFATFPDIIKLSDGRYRMYFQNTGVIKSAISQDGLTWKDEQGIRIDASENGFDIENVGAQTTMFLDDGTYIMVYRGTINQKYSQEVPNSITTLFFYAISKDGIIFEKQGIALDSRNSMFKGWLDGPEWVEWDESNSATTPEIRLYFWSYKGVYHLTYKDGNFSEDAVFDYTTSNNPLNQFPQNPPGDPTLAKINGKWFMYYGGHTQGIYYATYEP